MTSHTYIFLDDVIRQPAAPPGFPTRWRNRGADYAMDQRVVNDPVYSGEIKDDLKSVPSLCIVIPNADFFGSNGLYSNGTATGDQWERAATIEWIDPNTGDQFGINAGLRSHGGVGRSDAKHALRVAFRSQYGAARLQFPLFEDSPIDTFDGLVLRSQWNYSWIGDSTYCSGMGTQYAEYLREAFARDTCRDLGILTPHARHVHMYVNGLYWGLYLLSERPDAGFAAAHLGGDQEDYDVLSAPDGGAETGWVKSGDTQAWNALFAMADKGLATPQAYQAIQQVVDVPAMIDYMLMVYYTGSRDAPVLLCSDQTPRNFWAIRRREPAGSYVFLPWDVEWSLERTNVNRVPILGTFNPHYLMAKLAANPDFRMLLVDHIHRRFDNGGALTPESATHRYMARANQIYGGIVGESARWGDDLRSQPYTRTDWLFARDYVIDQYFPVRTDIVLNQLKAQGWYPSVEPPVFQINGRDQRGGAVASGAVLTMVDPDSSGTIYYTLDGSDPRLSQANQQAVPVVTLVPENAPKRVWIPTEDIGTTWRGGNEPFDDSAWTDAAFLPKRAGGVGYEMERGYEAFISYDVFSAMYGQNASCYIRIPFTVTAQDLASLKSLTLRARCDDGFVAFLNGVEVASLNRPATLAWDSTCADRPDSTEFADIPILDFVSILRAGGNVLAVHALNEDAASLHFLFSTELIASTAMTTNPEVSPSATPYTGPVTLQASAEVKARVLGNQWSALSEAVYAVGPVADGLRISELMYHPAGSGGPSIPTDPNREFIELTNIGTDTINLALVQFTQGIDFRFPVTDLGPGQYVLVVADVNAFELAYGKGLPIAGRYSGSLSNAGERIQLCDAIGRIIVDFTYSDAWYGITDGGGYSLTVADVKADPGGLSSAGGWRPSAHVGGSPGRGGF